MTYLAPLSWLVVGILSSLIFVKIIKNMAWNKGWLSVPRKDRWSKKRAALHGGVGLIVAWGLASIVMLFITPNFNPQFVLFLLVCLGITVVGLYDDLHILPLSLKLIIPVIATLILALNGWYLPLFNAIALNILVTSIWVMLVIHAVNILDNMDGLAAGSVAITLLFFSLIFRTTNPFLLINCLLFVGVLIGFLYHNFSREKIFMGDSGSNLVGLYVAFMTIIIGSTFMKDQPLILNRFLYFVPMGAGLFVPLFAATTETLSRIKYRLLIFEGGVDHISHRLVRAGYKEYQVVIGYYSVTALAGLVSFILFFHTAWQLGILVATVLVLILIEYLYIFRNDRPKNTLSRSK